MRFEFTQMNCFKSFSEVKSTQEERVRFIKGNDLKETQIELLSFFVFELIPLIKLQKFQVYFFL